MSDLEIRHWNGRAAAPTVNDDNKLSGRAAPFNSPTMIGKAPWGFREQIKPVAFNKTLNDGDQVLLDNHDSARPLCRSSAGTLQLHPGHKGLDWEGQTTDTTYAQDVVKNVRAGNYGGCSFSFEVVSDTWDEGTDDGIPMRTLNEVNLREISIVTFPAYADTSVSARSMVDRAMEFRSRWYERELLTWKPDDAGDVDYADPQNREIPIVTKAQAAAAWAYVTTPRNADRYPLNGVTLASVREKIRGACQKLGAVIPDSGPPEPDNSRTFECEDFKLITTGEWDDRQWADFIDELRWVKKVSGYGPDGEPDSSTHLTKEETALLGQRMADQRRAIYESRKSSFAK